LNDEPFFTPRPAVAHYLEFVRVHGIGHAASSFTSDVPVVAGVTNEIAVQLPTGLHPEDFAIQWPAGWLGLGWRRSEAGVPVALRVGVPAAAQGDQEVQAMAIRAAPDLRAKARLHVVPRLVVPRFQRGPELRHEVAWPLNSTKILISHTNLWEGKTRDAADSQAVVSIVQDDTTVFMEVQVTDDSVVSNIASDDIKGHWRSDSVELCFDPRPGSEHTLGCYKLGIFPFDATGRVRAARDADAHPGLVEETAPGTRLVSWRTADGYVIRVAIPRAELGLPPGGARELGFNVLVYDGDKTNAVPGENINKSRIAWTPRGGVQGRPEDWGRLILE